MRRLLNETVAYIRGLAGATARGWDAFLFTPADPTPLGVMRVAIGALAFWSLFVYGLDLRAFLGSDGWADPAALQFVQGREKPVAWTFWTLVPDGGLRAVWVGALVVLAMFTAGLFSRVTAVLAWVILVATARRVPVSLFGFDQAVATLTLYLAATGASGQAVSLDRFLARWKQARAELLPAKRKRDGRWTLPSGVPTPTVSANLALRLVQLHFCLIYGMAGLAKLQGPAWWNGMAIWGTLASGEFNLIDFTPLAAFPWLLNLLTHAALGLEILYPALIWSCWLRPILLALVVVLHVGIGLTAPGLSEFALAMIAGNLAFVSGPWLRSLATGVDPGVSAGRVLYDGACPRCRASMALLTAGDPDRLIDPVDLTAVDVKTVHPSLTRDACMKAMHLVGSDGRVWAGYDAVVRLALWLPLFRPLGWLGRLPGVTWLGRRAYNAVAASRPREVCNDDVCGLHPPSGRRDRDRHDGASTSSAASR